MENEFEKERKEHPTLPPKIIRQILADHKKAKESCHCPIRERILKSGL